jgi:hypothetical protein
MSRELTSAELKLIPHGIEDVWCDTKADPEIFYGTWHKRDVCADSLTRPWRFDTNEPEFTDEPELTVDDWEQYYPGIRNVQILSWYHLGGTYQGRRVKWSDTQNCFTYRNNLPVIFVEPSQEDVDTAEVDLLLESSIASISQNQVPQDSPRRIYLPQLVQVHLRFVGPIQYRLDQVHHQQSQLVLQHRDPLVHQFPHAHQFHNLRLFQSTFHQSQSLFLLYQYRYQSHSHK